MNEFNKEALDELKEEMREDMLRDLAHEEYMRRDWEYALANYALDDNMSIGTLNVIADELCETH